MNQTATCEERTSHARSHYNATAFVSLHAKMTTSDLAGELVKSSAVCWGLAAEVGNRPAGYVQASLRKGVDAMVVKRGCAWASRMGKRYFMVLCAGSIFASNPPVR